MAGDETGRGASSWGIPREVGPPSWHPEYEPTEQEKQQNKYKRRLEDIDPARADPSAMIEHHEQIRMRPSPYTVEGYIQGFRDLSDAAIKGHGVRRSRARLLVIITLIALAVPVGLQLLGLLQFL